MSEFKGMQNFHESAVLAMLLASEHIQTITEIEREVPAEIQQALRSQYVLASVAAISISILTRTEHLSRDTLLEILCANQGKDIAAKLDAFIEFNLALWDKWHSEVPPVAPYTFPEKS